MKNFFLASLAAFILFSCGANKQTTTDKNDTGAFIADGYKRKKYKKILVIAMLRQPEFRQRVEKSLVDQLRDRNFNVVASTEIYTDEMLKDTFALRKTAEDAGVDAAIVLTSMGTNSKSVDHTQFNGNFFGWFGFTFAILDVTSTTSKVNYVQMDFVIADKLGTQYRVAIPVKTSNNSAVALQRFGLEARNRLLTDRIL